MKILPYFTVLSLSLFIGGLASLQRVSAPSAIVDEENSSMMGVAKASRDASDVTRSGVMPAYFRGRLLSLTYSVRRGGRADRALVNGRPTRRIFVCDSDLPGDRPFLSVIDAAPALFGPPWLETRVRFRSGHTPRQLDSAEAIEAAAERGEVELDYTRDVYRCEEAISR